MKFIGKGTARTESVYDPESQTFIADIVEGVFETEDERVIKRLQELGYGFVPPEEEKRKPGRPKKEQET